MGTIAFVLAILPCYFLLTSIWSAYLGPLSKIPGPKLAALTRLVMVWHKSRGTAESWKLNLHRQYGNVVRVTPTDVSFADGAAWKEIYGTAPGSNSAKLKKEFAFYGNNATNPSMINADDAGHRRQRKCFNNAFSDQALREQEPMVLKYVDQLVSNIRQTTTGDQQKVDLGKQYNFATFDIMADLAFGEPLGCLDKSEYITWITSIFAALRLITIIGEIARFPRIVKLLSMIIPPAVSEKEKQHRAFAVDRVEKRLAAETKRSDIWGFVLASEEKNLVLTKPEMHENAAFFMIAGTETTATLLTGFTYFLLMNAKSMDKLKQEIRNAFTSADQIRLKELSSLEYLSACIQETFRMHPPVPLGMPRVMSKGGGMICGYHIPGGTTVHVHHLSTYRNPNNFAHADTYLPQRWLATSEKSTEEEDTQSGKAIDATDFDNDNKSCLQPFSVGPNSCIGQNLAMLEIRLITAHILWHFDLEIVEESKGWDDRRVFTLWEPKPLEVVATPVHRANTS